MSYKKLNLSQRQKRQRRVRKKVLGSPERPRLCVFRSARHIYVQAIDDTTGATLASASTLDKEYSAPKEKGKLAKAQVIGELIAKRLLAKELKKVVFDRNGFLYHGRIKAVAEGARKAGLDF
ncbi:MAG TPA: 50S ribosomal protein L18 [bacterium]|nr:50S ribosomal protein L18 [bacterium]